MSHAKERHEKICLNCNADLIGRYCQNCGQENIEPHETVWSLVHHFFADITHFDGKFFSTVKYLITKPGFLSKEYISGRRARYLHPIRMYVFTSAIFFLAFFSYAHFEKEDVENKLNNALKVTSDETWQESEEKTLSRVKTAQDSAEIKDAYAAMRKLRNNPALTPPNPYKKGKKGKVAPSKVYLMVDTIYPSRQAYDSMQARLPKSERDGFWMRQIQYRNIHIQEKYDNDRNAFFTELINKFFHTFPYLLFISLPLYAIFLKLLYIRRKNFLYVDHAMFLIHLYIFTFLFFLLQMLVMELNSLTGWWIFDWVIFLMYLAGIYYAYKAMRKFYGQRRAKTILKFMLFNFLCVVSLILLFGAFIIFTVFRI